MTYFLWKKNNEWKLDLQLKNQTIKIISFEVFENYNESQIDIKKTRKLIQNENHKKRYKTFQINRIYIKEIAY